MTGTMDRVGAVTCCDVTAWTESTVDTPTLHPVFGVREGSDRRVSSINGVTQNVVVRIVVCARSATRVISSNFEFLEREFDGVGVRGRSRRTHLLVIWWKTIAIRSVAE
jgi:hypothetical protein